MDIVAIRKEIIEKRKNLSFAYRLESCDLILDKLVNMQEYKDAKHILVYADAHGEVMTDKIILTALLDGKSVYAPVCGEDFSMDFYHIYALEELYSGAYGVREPLAIEYEKLTESVDGSEIVALIPGVLFDKKGNRVGHGLGYYDRYFAGKDVACKIGLAYDFQVYDDLETKSHDIPMDIVLTDR